MEHAAQSAKQAARSEIRGGPARRASADAPPLHPMFQLQRDIGNQAILSLMRAGAIQAKLAVGAVDDPEEKEADEVADRVMRKPSGAGAVGACTCAAGGEMCEECQRRDLGSTTGTSTIRRRPKTAAAHSDAPSIVHQTLATSGSPLDSSTRTDMEFRFGRDFSDVRVHTDRSAAESANAIDALAYTAGNHIAFGQGQFAPHSDAGGRLLAHELAHVAQQGAAQSDMPLPPSAFAGATTLAHRPFPRVARQADTIEVDIIASRDEYQPPGSAETYRVGDAAASRLLMDIQERGAAVVFRVFNLETGVAQEMSPSEWSFLRGAAIIGGENAGVAKLGRQLSPSQWRSLWPNPTSQILHMFESGTPPIDDEALLSTYHGIIRSDAARSLDENERAIDQTLAAPDRVQRIQEFAIGLREASLVRDALVQRRDELSRRLVAQHSFTFGLPHAGTGPDVAQQLNIVRQRGDVEETLAFWLSAFPLLTRLQTQEIAATTVEATLREIKANIVSTRQELNRGRLDPMTLGVVRERANDRLGLRAKAAVQAEDRSRARWAIVGGVATTAATIGLLFLPGGIFIDAAIGVAIAGHAIANAAELGRAANTGLHVDDGLVSQAQAQEARFAAVLATVFAVVGVAAAGFRVLRVGLALRGLSRSMPELALAERGAVARAIADDPALLSTFTKTASGDTAISARVTAAVQQAAGDVPALRMALQDIARIAAIPRRVLTGPDLYEPLRMITDGSDIERIATQTGLSKAEVEAAKRNLMFDEHILVDNTTGALYRGRFEPFKDIAEVWGRAARDEATQAERQFLRRLVRHEQAEGAILSTSRQTLEQAFLRGGLEGRLRTFLQSKGFNQAKIEQLIAVEPKPITPYRYAHLVAALSGAPNP
jgi:hypothetical protein